LWATRVVSVALLDGGSTPSWQVHYLLLASPAAPSRLDSEIRSRVPSLASVPGHVEGHGTEAQLLEAVHARLGGDDIRLVTFGGRRYDYPVLIHRAARHGVRPAKCVMAAATENRYRQTHYDMFDILTFYGAATASLRAFALGYGLHDPKAGGSGADVEELWRAEEYTALAAYNLGDVVTLRELKRLWHETTGG
jgi:hypothetical protein